MFTATIINPAARHTAEFASLEEAEKWAFWGEYFVRGCSRVIITDPNGEAVSWY